MNYTFVGLARTAGFAVRRSVRRSSPVICFLPQMQDPSQIGADIVWVHAGTQDYYLDPAASTFPLEFFRGMKPTRAAFVAARPAAKSSPCPRRHLRSSHHHPPRGTRKLIPTGRPPESSSWTTPDSQAAVRREQSREEDEAGRRKTIGDEIQGWLPAGSTYEVTAITNWDKNDQALARRRHCEDPQSRNSRGTPHARSGFAVSSPQSRSLSSRKTSLRRLFHFPV